MYSMCSGFYVIASNMTSSHPFAYGGQAYAFTLHYTIHTKLGLYTKSYVKTCISSIQLHNRQRYIIDSLNS